MPNSHDLADPTPSPAAAGTPVKETSSPGAFKPINGFSKKRKAIPQTPKNGAEITTGFAADDNDDDDMDDDYYATPTKKKKTTRTAGTPKSSTSKPATARKRKAPMQPIVEGSAIPRSYEECNEADKKLLDMRDAGHSWTDIRREVERITGRPSAASTLPNRYSRLKTNLTVISDADSAKLLECKKEVEAAFEREKWVMIGKAMVIKGTGSYKPDALQRQYKKIIVKAGYTSIDGGGGKENGENGDDDGENEDNDNDDDE